MTEKLNLMRDGLARYLARVNNSEAALMPITEAQMNNELFDFMEEENENSEKNLMNIHGHFTFETENVEQFERKTSKIPVQNIEELKPDTSKILVQNVEKFKPETSKIPVQNVNTSSTVLGVVGCQEINYEMFHTFEWDELISDDFLQ